MSKYLLNCPCGKQVSVDVGQAGGKVACACGKQLDVPTLRNLRHLPQVETDRAAATVGWNPRKGIIAASLIVAGLLAAYAGWNFLTEPTVPKFADVYDSSEVEANWDKMNPVEAWTLWIDIYRPLAKTGFHTYEHPHKAAIEDHVAFRRVLQSTLLIIAAVAVAIAITAALWPKEKGRQGDKATRGNR
jgi:hypothetical protein